MPAGRDEAQGFGTLRLMRAGFVEVFEQRHDVLKLYFPVASLDRRVSPMLLAHFVRNAAV
jgi:hypothetical protein